MLHRFLRNWSLPIAMLSGVVMYLLYTNIPLFRGSEGVVSSVVSIVQPGLIFSMLFVTFCKVRIGELKPAKWHVWLLAFQLVSFVAMRQARQLYPAESGLPAGCQHRPLCQSPGGNAHSGQYLGTGRPGALHDADEVSGDRPLSFHGDRNRKIQQ